jgi:hypothetical protein
MMAERKPPRSKKEIADDLKEAYLTAKKEVRAQARKEEAHKAILIGKSLQARANNGNAASKQELAAILDGFTRDQDRRAFGLDPLPGNPSADPAKPPSAADIAAETARYQAARRAFNDGRETVESARLQAGYVEATIILERLTGSVVTDITPENRKGFGLGARPGERLKAS